MIFHCTISLLIIPYIIIILNVKYVLIFLCCLRVHTRLEKLSVVKLAGLPHGQEIRKNLKNGNSQEKSGKNRGFEKMSGNFF